MTGADPEMSDYLAALEATWPPAQREATDDGLVFRRDAPEAGSRVCSARLERKEIDVSAASDRIEAYYAGRGRSALYQAPRTDLSSPETPEHPLEEALAARGFAPFDPSALLVAHSTDAALEARSRAAERGVHAVEVLTPLAMLDQFWARAGVGPERLAVMRRALAAGRAGSVVVVRIESRLRGAAFWALAPSGIAFVQALHVAPETRRQGGASALIGFAALKAKEAGATRLCASVVRDNGPSTAVFKRCGFKEVGGYVYWRKPL